MDEDDAVWTAAASLAALGAAKLASNFISKTWERKRGAVPGDPVKDNDVSWSEAMLFAAVSGVTLGVVRLLAQRGVSFAYDKRKGNSGLKA